MEYPGSSSSSRTGRNQRQSAGRNLSQPDVDRTPRFSEYGLPQRGGYSSDYIIGDKELHHRSDTITWHPNPARYEDPGLDMNVMRQIHFNVLLLNIQREQLVDMDAEMLNAVVDRIRLQGPRMPRLPLREVCAYLKTDLRAPKELVKQVEALQKEGETSMLTADEPDRPEQDFRYLIDPLDGAQRSRIARFLTSKKVNLDDLTKSDADSCQKATLPYLYINGKINGDRLRDLYRYLHHNHKISVESLKAMDHCREDLIKLSEEEWRSIYAVDPRLLIVPYTEGEGSAFDQVGSSGSQTYTSSSYRPGASYMHSYAGPYVLNSMSAMGEERAQRAHNNTLLFPNSK